LFVHHSASVFALIISALACVCFAGVRTRIWSHSPASSPNPAVIGHVGGCPPLPACAPWSPRAPDPAAATPPVKAACAPSSHGRHPRSRCIAAAAAACVNRASRFFHLSRSVSPAATTATVATHIIPAFRGARRMERLEACGGVLGIEPRPAVDFLSRCLGLRVWGLGFRVWGLGFGVWNLGFRAWGDKGLEFGVENLGFGIWVPGFQGLGIRV